MVLARHIDPDSIVKEIQSRPDKSKAQEIAAESHLATVPPFASRYAFEEETPRFRLPQRGTEAVAAHEMIKYDLDLDGVPNLNLASFVGTYMEREANGLMMENISKNLSDADEYPYLMTIHSRCITMIANLWHAQHGEQAIGSATIGSSEAVLLGGLAMKRRWQERRKAQGKDTSRPNIIMGSNAQVALLKFARYFEVEPRILPVTRKSQHRLDPDLVREAVDENTIGIFVILGSTFTGHYEPVEEISDILDEIQKEKGWDVPIHVDAASGGFIVPFTYVGTGGKKWDFELPRVVSINVSGHKYGLVYAGLGWIVWRDPSYLPKDLIFELDYLGGTEQTFTLNFSRPGAHVIGQYFNFVRLGFEGYQGIMEGCLANARLLSKGLEKTGWFECLSDIHRKKGVYEYQSIQEQESLHTGDSSADFNPGLPVVAFKFTETFKKDYPNIKQAAVSKLLRMKGYIIPNYSLPEHEEHIQILRVVIRESMSRELVQRLLQDTVSVTEELIKSDPGDLIGFQSPPGGSERKLTKSSEQINRDGDGSKEGEKGHTKDKKGKHGHRSVC